MALSISIPNQSYVTDPGCCAKQSNITTGKNLQFNLLT